VVEVAHPTKEGYQLSNYFIDSKMTIPYEAGPITGDLVL
jgi:hypothetical protein